MPLAASALESIHRGACIVSRPVDAISNMKRVSVTKALDFADSNICDAGATSHDRHKRKWPPTGGRGVSSCCVTSGRRDIVTESCVEQLGEAPHNPRFFTGCKVPFQRVNLVLDSVLNASEVELTRPIGVLVLLS